jgi:hypothetical protein
VAILGSAGAKPRQNYTFQVAECRARTSYPKGMNYSGTVVGGAQTLNSIDSWAFIYAHGACKTIGPGEDGISFTGIADKGEVLGIYIAPAVSCLKKAPYRTRPLTPAAKFTFSCCLNTSTSVLAGNYLMTGSQLQYDFPYENGPFTALPSSYYHYAPLIAGMNNKRG